MTKNRNKDRQASQTDEHTAPINPNAADPLNQVVAACAEDKPLVTEERNCDCDNVAQHSGIEIGIRAETAEQPVQERKETVAEQRVETADNDVAHELRKLTEGVCFHGVNTAKN